MALDPKHIGRKYGPYKYTLGVEKMREFAYAVCGGEPGIGITEPPANLHPLLHDEKAAKASPYGDVIAFPTFVVNFAMTPFGAAFTDPTLGVNLMMLVHGEQEFEFFEVMRPGDVMETTGTITEIYEKASKDFLVVVTESYNQHGKLAVRGTWTAVIRQ
jgi:acyl dehydratase